MKRMIVVQAVQLPLLGLLYWGRPPASLWLAGVIGSVICCYGTDSNWRWRNRALVAQAALWLCVPLLFADSI